MTRPNKSVLGLLLSLGAISTLAVAQQGQQPPPLSIKQLTNDIYWTQGGAGGNTGIILGQNGVIVIDAKTTPASAKEMLDGIAKITPKPVTTVILTHSDNDHVGGLPAFPRNVTVIAHENNKKEQEEALAKGGRGAPSKDYLPTRVITKDRESLQIEGVNLILIHTGRAHTSGDLAIYVPDEKILFAGDLLSPARPAPLIHMEKNGSPEGWVTFVKTLGDLDAQTYVPGHGDLQTKPQVQKTVTGLSQQLEQIKTMVEEGKSLPDIKKAMGDPEPPAQPGPGQFPTWADNAYQEFTAKK